ncbi:MAG TPA: 8-amino-7-oxononanoate synthase [bacterium]|nr:8-amino-7-oxononanoate synthase [bacterium]
MDWIEELRQELAGLEAQGLKRALRTVDPLGGAKARVEGRDCVLFCSNNYLGLADHPRVVKMARQALDRYGAGSQASRLVSGNFPIHDLLEEKTALFKDTEACLAFPTGYMANLAAVSALVGDEDAVLCDRLNHASLIDACRSSKAKLLVYEHLNLADLRACLERARNYRRRLIVTDSLFSMDGDVAPLPGIMELASEFEALVLIDDAHGTGVLGVGGRGGAHHFALKTPPTAVVGTYSKALGSLGGFVGGSKTLVEALLNKARTFIYTTGLPPSVCGASLGALEVLEEEPDRVEKLRQNAAKIRAGLQGLGFKVPDGESPIIPVMVGDNEKAVQMSSKLLEEGILVVAIRPPTVPKDTARLRLSVSSAHSEDEISQLFRAFQKL